MNTEFRTKFHKEWNKKENELLEDIEDCKKAVLESTQKNQWKWIIFYTKQVDENQKILDQMIKDKHLADRILERLQN